MGGYEHVFYVEICPDGLTCRIYEVDLSEFAVLLTQVRELGSAGHFEKAEDKLTVRFLRRGCDREVAVLSVYRRDSTIHHVLRIFDWGIIGELVDKGIRLQAADKFLMVCPACGYVGDIREFYYPATDLDYDGTTLFYIAFKCPRCGYVEDLDELRCT